MILPWAIHTDVVMVQCLPWYHLWFYRTDPFEPLASADDIFLLIMQDPDTGLPAENDHPASIAANPNPTTGQAIVTGTIGQVDWHLFDTLGREHLNGNGAVNAQLAISMEGLTPGIYVLRVQDAAGEHAIRLVKE
jgi:hypothetical protein